jgi:hypothetical protein
LLVLHNFTEQLDKELCTIVGKQIDWYFLYEFQCQLQTVIFHRLVTESSQMKDLIVLFTNRVLGLAQNGIAQFTVCGHRKFQTGG